MSEIIFYEEIIVFAELTKEEEALGLLDNTRHIGTLQEWTRLLLQQGVTIVDHHGIVTH